MTGAAADACAPVTTCGECVQRDDCGWCEDGTQFFGCVQGDTERPNYDNTFPCGKRGINGGEYQFDVCRPPYTAPTTAYGVVTAILVVVVVCCIGACCVMHFRRRFEFKFELVPRTEEEVDELLRQTAAARGGLRLEDDQLDQDF